MHSNSSGLEALMSISSVSGSGYSAYTPPPSPAPQGANSSDNSNAAGNANGPPPISPPPVNPPANAGGSNPLSSSGPGQLVNIST